ncbi:MAG TPA: polyprenyl synthetase family protein [Candidatus Azoamicus sp.]
MKFDNIKNNFKIELNEIDNFIKENLKSNISIIGDIGSYIISYGGKKIRPLITIIFDKILENSIEQTIKISSAIELIHTATLLHDDVVDLSEKRRGKLSVNKIWGNKEAILVGDYLYTKSFEIMVTLQNLNLLNHMAKTTNIMSEGEVNQLLHKNNFDIKESDYFKIIKCKTAQLFASSATVSAILSKNKSFILPCFSYGMNLGIAYQLIDDMLDYTSTDENFGKNTGDDILNGTFTLPLIYAMSEKKRKDEIKNIILNLKSENLIEIKNLVVNSQALDYTRDAALKHIKKAKKAISIFNNSKNKEMANYILEFITERTY